MFPMSRVFPPMSIYGFSCSTFPVCSLIYHSSQLCLIAPHLFQFSSFDFLLYKILVSPCLPRSLLNVFRVLLKPVFDYSPCLLAPCSPLREPDRTANQNSRKRRFSSLVFVFPVLKSFLFPVFLAPAAMEVAARFITLAHRDLPFPEYSREFCGLAAATALDDATILSLFWHGPIPIVPWTSQTPRDYAGGKGSSGPEPEPACRRPRLPQARPRGPRLFLTCRQRIWQALWALILTSALQSPCWSRPALQSPCWFRPALQSPCWSRPALQSPCWSRPALQSPCWSVQLSRAPAGSVQLSRAPSSACSPQVPSSACSSQVPSSACSSQVPSSACSSQVPSSACSSQVPASAHPRARSSPAHPRARSSPAPSSARACRAPSSARACRAPSSASACRGPSSARACRAPSSARACRAPPRVRASRAHPRVHASSAPPSARWSPYLPQGNFGGG